MVVDDEVAMVRSLELLLRPLGDIHKAYSVPEVEEAMAKNIRPDCIVTDITMPEASGLELLDQVQSKHPEIPVIVMTAYSSVSQAVEAMQKGAFEYIVKPFENTDLTNVVKKALRKKGLVHGETKRMPEGWVCNSQAMKDFLMKAEKAALHDSPVLILGETGVGKRRASRWMHEMGKGSKKEFYSVDARAHEEDSAFLEKTFGKVGSLFIAEVFSLSEKFQDRLAEILAEGKVKIICSSSSSPEFQSLPNFREDLFKALTGMTVKVPALRERPEDFDGLVSRLVSELAQRMKFRKLELHDGVLKKLREHDFPGNIKELEQVLERAALEAKAGLIIEEGIHFTAPNLKQILPFAIPAEDGWNRLSLLKESLEKELIIRALEKYPNYSNTEIAKLLGTTRRILELRMKAYRIRET
jgi:DNA-binding NtrC family response regulator